MCIINCFLVTWAIILVSQTHVDNICAIIGCIINRSNHICIIKHTSISFIFLTPCSICRINSHYFTIPVHCVYFFFTDRRNSYHPFIIPCLCSNDSRNMRSVIVCICVAYITVGSIHRYYLGTCYHTIIFIYLTACDDHTSIRQINIFQIHMADIHPRIYHCHPDFLKFIGLLACFIPRFPCSRKINLF